MIHYTHHTQHEFGGWPFSISDQFSTMFHLTPHTPRRERNRKPKNEIEKRGKLCRVFPVHTVVWVKNREILYWRWRLVQLCVFLACFGLTPHKSTRRYYRKRKRMLKERKQTKNWIECIVYRILNNVYSVLFYSEVYSIKELKKIWIQIKIV